MERRPAFASPIFPSRLLSGYGGCTSKSSVRPRRPMVLASVRIALPETAPLNITADPFAEDERQLLLPPTMRRGNTVNPIIVIPGYGSSARSYSGLRQNLLDSLPPGADVTVVPLTTWSWATTVGGRPVTKILTTLDATVRATLRRTGASHVNLIAHSAGGWIARLYLGDAPYPDLLTGKAWQGRNHVRQLLCLGTPHVSGEPITKRNMSFVNDQYPGAFYESVEYINFGGDAVTVPISMKHIPRWQFWQPLWMARLSYYLTDPLADKEHSHVGDGIVPLSVTFLEGARANVRLKGVWHSPDARGPWYGNERVVRYWSQFLK